jgi:oligopeptide/dipeptide ABC transporter ATP-binding protein
MGTAQVRRPTDKRQIGAESILAVNNLGIDISTYEGTFRVLDNVAFTMYKNEWTGLVGETGCGKTITASSILGLLPRAAEIVDGTILFHGANILGMDESSLRSIRGSKITMIFQNPKTACNPAFKIGTQLAETIKLHSGLSTKAAVSRGEELLSSVGLQAYCMSQYPHELSGGMLQRVMISLALACDPEVILADEPTSSLDVTVQKEIITLMKEISRDFSLSVLFITHDLLLVLQNCTNIVVMYAGRVVERGLCKSILQDARHPYTRAILSAMIDINTRRDRLEEIQGNPPDQHDAVSRGCLFAPRCSSAIKNLCEEIAPTEAGLVDDHFVSCHLCGRLSP